MTIEFPIYVLSNVIKTNGFDFTTSLPLQIRGGSRAAAISKMECFAIIVNGFQPLTIITKYSNSDVAAALDLPLQIFFNFSKAALIHGICVLKNLLKMSLEK